MKISKLISNGAIEYISIWAKKSTSESFNKNINVPNCPHASPFFVTSYKDLTPARHGMYKILWIFFTPVI